MGDFDRIKPPERRLLERGEQREPDAERADRQGRAALFSVATPPSTPGAGVPPPRPDDVPPPPPSSPSARRPDGSPGGPDDPRLPQGASPVRVTCGHCGVTCPLPLGHALRQAVPLVLIAPWRSHPVFATCPCGQRRAWLKPSVARPER